MRTDRSRDDNHQSPTFSRDNVIQVQPWTFSSRQSRTLIMNIHILCSISKTCIVGLDSFFKNNQWRENTVFTKPSNLRHADDYTDGFIWNKLENWASIFTTGKWTPNSLKIQPCFYIAWYHIVLKSAMRRKIHNGYTMQRIYGQTTILTQSANTISVQDKTSIST